MMTSFKKFFWLLLLIVTACDRPTNDGDSRKSDKEIKFDEPDGIYIYSHDNKIDEYKPLPSFFDFEEFQKFCESLEPISYQEKHVTSHTAHLTGVMVYKDGDVAMCILDMHGNIFPKITQPDKSELFKQWLISVMGEEWFYKEILNE